MTALFIVVVIIVVFRIAIKTIIALLSFILDVFKNLLLAALSIVGFIAMSFD